MTGYGQETNLVHNGCKQGRGGGGGGTVVVAVVAEVVHAGSKQIQDTSMFWEWIWPETLLGQQRSI